MKENLISIKDRTSKTSKTMPKKSFTSLYKRTNVADYSLLYNEVIKFNDRKFNITIDVHNGNSRADLKILTSGGTWEYLTDSNYCDINLLSYVCCDNDRLIADTIKRVQDEFIKYIKAVYVD